MDRATVNYTAMPTLCLSLAALRLPNLCIHVEPCGCHGGALVKGKSTHGKATAVALNAFSKLTKDKKVANALSRACFQALGVHLLFFFVLVCTYSPQRMLVCISLMCWYALLMLVCIIS